VSPRNIFRIKNVLIHYYICARKIIPLKVLKYRPYDVGGAVEDCCKMILRMPGIVVARGKTRPNRIKSKHNGIALEFKNIGSVLSRHFSEWKNIGYAIVPAFFGMKKYRIGTGLAFFGMKNHWIRPYPSFFGMKKYRICLYSSFFGMKKYRIGTGFFIFHNEKPHCHASTINSTQKPPYFHLIFLTKQP
jgi:hypothetical protein